MSNFWKVFMILIAILVIFGMLQNRRTQKMLESGFEVAEIEVEDPGYYN